MAADQEIQFIAVEAVSKMVAPERAEQMDEEGDHGEQTGKQQSCAQRRSREDGRKIFWDRSGATPGAQAYFAAGATGKR